MKKLNIVIIGGSDWLGESLACYFAPFAECMVILARTEEKLKKVQLEIQNTCPTYSIICDLARLDHVRLAVKDIELHLNSVDLILNVAGGSYVGSTYNCKSEDFFYMVDAYIKGQAFLIKSLIPLIRRSQKTVLVNFLADWVNRKAGMEAGNAIYTMTKAAMEAFSNSLASEEHINGLQISNLYLGQVAESENNLLRDEKGNLDMILMSDICKFVLSFMTMSSLHVLEATLVTKSPSYARTRLHTNATKWDMG
jgi:NADP-dependent 3-hydroxy acid dehydrogenase YdfG